MTGHIMAQIRRMVVEDQALIGTSLEVARALKSLGVPFVVYSGLPSEADRPMELQGVPWLEKPVSRETLMSVLGRLAGPEKGLIRVPAGRLQPP